MEMVEEQEKEGRGMGGREEEPGMLDAACDYGGGHLRQRYARGGEPAVGRDWPARPEALAPKRKH